MWPHTYLCDSCFFNIPPPTHFIRHENIVTLLDVVVGRDLKMVFLSMEYCAHDLAALVDTLPVAFKEDQVKCLVLQLVRGVKCKAKCRLFSRV